MNKFESDYKQVGIFMTNNIGGCTRRKITLFSDLTVNYNYIFLFLVSDEYDSYIIVSFVNATLVLSIGETVEEVTDSGFLGTTPTLSCHALGSDALVQVYPDGIRHIRSDKRVNEWKAPGKKSIVKCAVNQRQVVLALTGGELVYFEMDPVSINLGYYNVSDVFVKHDLGCAS